MTIAEESTTETTTTNRISNLGNGNIATTGQGVITLIYSPNYSGSSGRWVVTASKQ
jgi:hypothetical protein